MVTLGTFQALRDFLRNMSNWIWSKQNEAFCVGLTLHEETLTQMLLYRMATHPMRMRLTQCGIEFKLTLFNRNEEKRSGADWQWVVLTRNPHCFLSMRVQAKRLYHKDKGRGYEALRWNCKQTWRLIKNARATSSIPIYIFFNHEFGRSSRIFYKVGNHSLHYTPSNWGCSIVNAENINRMHMKTRGIDKLENLINYMIPMHCMISDDGICDVSSALSTISKFGSVDRAKITNLQIPEDQLELIENIHDNVYMSKHVEKYNLAGVAVFEVSGLPC